MTWKTYTCQISNKPAIVLVDNRYAIQTPMRKLPRLSWFGVYCNLPVGNGCWNPDENEILDKLEDDLIELCGIFGRGWAVYLLRIATPGIREYYIYHSDAAELNKAYLAVKATYPEYRIEFETNDDPGWKEYTKYVNFNATPSN